MIATDSQAMGMWVNDGGAPGGRHLPRVGDNDVFVRFKVIEPILMGPFTLGTTGLRYSDVKLPDEHASQC